MAVPMTIRLGTHVSPTITSDVPTFQPNKSLRQQVVISDTLDSNLLIVLLMRIRLGTHLSPTIYSDAATLHVCKQQQIASGNKYYYNILVSNWLIAVLMIIRLGIHVSPTITSDATTFKAFCKTTNSLRQ